MVVVVAYDSTTIIHLDHHHDLVVIHYAKVLRLMTYNIMHR